MNFKRFFAVFCPLLLIVAMVVSVAGMTYKSIKPLGDDDIDKDDLVKATGSMNVLLIGRDKSGKLTDTIMVARLDNDKKTVNILSIPRDTYVDGWKINAMYSIGGIKKTKECVEDITGIKIDHYVSITTDVFKEIVDLLDGVDFYVPQDMDYEDPVQGLYIHLREGQQHLDGDKAEQLVRFRSYIEGDIQRTSVQRDFIRALIKQKKSMQYIGKVDDIYRVVSSKLETDIKLKDILANVMTFAELNVSKNLNTYVMPNTPQYVSGISYVFVNKEELNELLIEKFGMKPEDFENNSSEHVFNVDTYDDGYVSYGEDYDDNAAWYTPDVSDTEGYYEGNTGEDYYTYEEPSQDYSGGDASVDTYVEEVPQDGYVDVTAE